MHPTLSKWLSTLELYTEDLALGEVSSMVLPTRISRNQKSLDFNAAQP